MSSTATEFHDDIIYPNTAAKVREYKELITRTFFLVNAEAKQVQNLIKTVIKTKDIYIDERLNVIVMKDTVDAVRLAEQLVESVDVAEPEVMLEVEVLEVSSNKMKELGIDFPDQMHFLTRWVRAAPCIESSSAGLRHFP